MRFLLLLLLVILISFSAFSQYHFMYIQADNQKPFSVVLNNKAYTSSSSGYVIVPRLTDTLYNFTVRFNGAQAEERFQYLINKKDVGLNLKSFGNNGWGLQNFQSYAVTMAGKNDLAINTETKKPEKSLAGNKSYVKKDSAQKLGKRFNRLLVNLKLRKAATNQPALLSQSKGVIKATEFSDENGLNQLYIDILSKGMMDTVDVFIPYSAEEKALIFNKDGSKTSTAKANKGEVKNRFNVNCTYQASGADFFNLRKKMAAASNEDKMVEEARKAFKTRCFTTQQIKNLSVLFLTEEGKYKFFDGIYPTVYDGVLFKTLESEFTDPYYINRFKAMLK